MKNKIYTILILLFSCLDAFGQAPDWLWTRTATCHYDYGIGYGFCVAADNWGNGYIAGRYTLTSISFGSITLTHPDPGAIFFLAKYDSTGNVIWAKKAHGNGIATPFGITTDYLGNVYVTGCFQDSVSFGADTLFSPGYDVFLVKYDSSGHVLWAKSSVELGGIAYNASQSVTSDLSGNVYITGIFFSPDIMFGPYILVNSENSSLFIVKYDSSGNVLWAKRAGSNGIFTYNAESYSVTSDPSANIYITGDFDSPTIIFGSDTLHNSGAGAFFIAKYDSSGNVLWAKSAGSQGEKGISITAAHPSGNVYVTGEFNNSQPVTFGSYTLSGTAPWNNFIVKYDASGNVLWAKSFTNGMAFNIVSDSQENIFMNGKMRSDSMVFDTIVLPWSIDIIYPMFIVKYDSSGSPAWAKELPMSGGDRCGIGVSTNKSIYVGGYFHMVNPFIVGNDTIIPTCYEEIFMARLGYSLTNGISEISKDEEFILYPNPLNDKLNIHSTNNQLSEVSIYDITSRKLLQQSFTNSISLNTSQLSKGIYLYEIKNKNGVRKKGKVIKQ